MNLVFGKGFLNFMVGFFLLFVRDEEEGLFGGKGVIVVKVLFVKYRLENIWKFVMFDK